MNQLKSRLRSKLGIEDFRFVEIESKHRVLPEDAKDIRRHLLTRDGVAHQKTISFFDQFLDTPRLDILKKGASLRLRYKGSGAKVYLQYKGPGFHKDGLLFRSEFSSDRLTRVILEESHHDIVHFSETSVQDILRENVGTAMREAMRRHLGEKVIERISKGPIICLYQKEKFTVDLGSAVLEPSLDRLFAFHVGKDGPHPLSTFCEYENEIKAPDGDLDAKLAHLDELIDFDEKLAKRFDLKPEPLDKYHRCASCFTDN